MIRTIAAATGLLLGTGLTTAGTSLAGQAGPVPTITAPASAGYFSMAPVSGIAAPGQRVSLYVRTSPARSFYVSRTLTAGSTGGYATDIRVSGPFTVYARTSSGSSPARSVQVAAPRCTTTGPVTSNPIDQFQVSPPNRDDQFMAFTATSHGLWAGYAFSTHPLTFAAIVWRAGQKRPTIIATIHPYNAGYTTDAYDMIEVAGFTPTGAVVVGVRDGRGNMVPTVWSHANKSVLPHPASWSSVHPVAVTPTGGVVGWAVTGAGNGAHTVLARWASVTSPAQTVRTYADRYLQPDADSAGDFIFNDDNSHQVLIPAGSRAPQVLRWHVDPARFATAGRRDYVGGPDYETSALDVMGSGSKVSTTLTPVAVGDVYAASTQGSFIYEAPHGYQDYLVTRTRARLRLPTLPLDTGAPGAAIDIYGGAAITEKDDLVHFVHCH